MAASREAAEHFGSLLPVAGLAEHLAVEHHHRVGRQQDVPLAEGFGVGPALELCEVERHLFGRKFVWVALLAFEARGELIGKSAPGDQFASPRRLRCQQQAVVLEFLVE